MEDPGEDVSSTAAASRSFSGDGGSSASEESGWTSYIDYFMEAQQRPKGEVSRDHDPSADDAGRGRRSSTSECSSGTGVGASTWQATTVLVDSPVVSRRLSLREGWRRKKLLYDESLEDTATSPISSPKLIELRDSDATHHQTKMSSCDEISRSKRKNTGGDANGANTRTDTAVKEDSAYANNEAEEESRPLVGPYVCFPCIADDANKFIGC